MRRRALYLALAILGAIIPWLLFLDFFRTGDGGFVAALFANGAAGGFSADLLISSLVFWVFVLAESRRAGVGRPWLFVLVNVLIGLSCALPLFLWCRERAIAVARPRA